MKYVKSVVNYVNYKYVFGNDGSIFNVVYW